MTRKNSGRMVEEAIGEAQKTIFARSMNGWNSFAKEIVADFDAVFADMLSIQVGRYRTIEDLNRLSENYMIDSSERRSKIETITTKAKQFELESRSAHEANSKAMLVS